MAILGDGPVGVELAGEIRHQYPRKLIALVSPAGRLLTGANPRLGARIAKILREIDVRIEPAATALGGDVSELVLGIGRPAGEFLILIDLPAVSG